MEVSPRQIDVDGLHGTILDGLSVCSRFDVKLLKVPPSPSDWYVAKRQQ